MNNIPESTNLTGSSTIPTRGNKRRYDNCFPPPRPNNNSPLHPPKPKDHPPYEQSGPITRPFNPPTIA